VRTLVILAALGTLAVCASAADARSPFRLLGAGSAWTDGDRYAAINLKDQPAHVVDEWTGRAFDVVGPTGCFLQGVAEGTVLWQCDGFLNRYQPVERPKIEDLATGALRDVPGWDTYLRWFDATRYRSGFYGQGPTVSGFGSRWLSAYIWCYHCIPEDSYIDWHTGTFVERRSEVAERVPDLDDPELDVPLCAPLRRLPLHEDEDPPFQASAYDPPWFQRDAYTDRLVVRLHHCGRRKPILVARCRFDHCWSFQLGGGYLTWRQGLTVYAYRLASRHLLRVGSLPWRVQGPVVYHTRRTVYAFDSENTGVWAAPLPRR
jgi:hypothetical protein